MNAKLRQDNRSKTDYLIAFRQRSPIKDNYTYQRARFEDRSGKGLRDS